MIFSTERVSISRERLAPFLYEESEEMANAGTDVEGTGVTTELSPYVIDPDKKDQVTGNLTESQKARVAQLLGDWEEPEKMLGVEVRSP